MPGSHFNRFGEQNRYSSYRRAANPGQGKDGDLTENEMWITRSVGSRDGKISILWPEK
jgi:hypothetical protein